MKRIGFKYYRNRWKKFPVSSKSKTRQKKLTKVNKVKPFIHVDPPTTTKHKIHTSQTSLPKVRKAKARPNKPKQKKMKKKSAKDVQRR